MHNDEVVRLRHLRVAALSARATARALSRTDPPARIEHWLHSVSAASWRVSRTVTGHLRAHPCAQYRKDIGLPLLTGITLRALAVSHVLKRGTRGARFLAQELAQLSRLLADTRALTRTLDLSDSFGRSQNELRGLLGQIGMRNGDFGAQPLALTRPAASTSTVDWPYLSL